MELVVADVDDEAFLLDLLNTTPVIDGVVYDELTDPAVARHWLRAHGVSTTKEETAALVEVRAVLQDVVRGDRSAAALRPFVAGAQLRPVVKPDRIDWRIEPGDAPAAAARAVLAWDALRISSPGRLRPCANTECRLFLIDRSKPNTARWCSMAICGNRMKARRHYRRTHAGDE
ncbi:CGNR zinc finger domain-containing protein [Mycolicibacterium sp. 120270]|uniref:CGNR zinc finger domain-containing protein n=1 Tax=Mycolicibacterium sp. 120270 TaxID=3090600 RepID=UPI00299E32DC|nr:CGNR zinc finger domain-containing protein [Mycolicibacterium sp. 120270]MDX1882838.1 CGNR zinc finger domain-containing protein [Mycolicibacterium sp. 120270]